MKEIGDVVVTIRAKDEVSPVLRELNRRLWWYRWGPMVLRVLFWLVAVASFLLGRITA